MIYKKMNSQPICSESEQRCRWRQSVDCSSMTETDQFNGSVESSRETTDDLDALHDDSPCAEDLVQHLQEVEPTCSDDDSDRQTNASNKSQLFLSVSC